MDRDATPITIPGEDPTAVELVTAIRAGDVAAVRRLVGANPKLARARLFARGGTRTPLHIVADWPGYFPNGPQIVAVLIDAGADPNIGTTPKPSETPLHWAASSDDADVAAALIDGGADIEIPDGSIGTPLDNAIGYACWHVASGAPPNAFSHMGPISTGSLTTPKEPRSMGQHPRNPSRERAYLVARAGSRVRAMTPSKSSTPSQ